MVRVLHVIDSLDLGGAQTVLVNLARFHDRTKYEVSVAAMHGRGVFAEALTAEGVQVISLSPPNSRRPIFGHCRLCCAGNIMTFCTRIFSAPTGSPNLWPRSAVCRCG